MLEVLVILLMSGPFAIMDSDAPWDVFKNTKATFSSMRCLGGTCDPDCGPVPPECQETPLAQQAWDFCKEACGPCPIEKCTIVSTNPLVVDVQCKRWPWPPQCW